MAAVIMIFFRPNGGGPVGVASATTLALLMSGCVGGKGPSSESSNASGTTPSASTQLIDTRRFEINLEWDVPLTRINGRVLPVSELAGYEIQYHSNRQQEVSILRVNDALQTEAYIDDLPTGQYVFSIAAIDISGTYSDFSDQVSLDLQ